MAAILFFPPLLFSILLSDLYNLGPINLYTCKGQPLHNVNAYFLFSVQSESVFGSDCKKRF